MEPVSPATDPAASPLNVTMPLAGYRDEAAGITPRRFRVQTRLTKTVLRYLVWVETTCRRKGYPLLFTTEPEE
jgi:hypothetical protein